ncbi:MAG TPA: hypothetical protein VN874_07710, partial [Myxococcales bacterium]|nr:hypothetical protein [Myxococcales bacterium]
MRAPKTLRPGKLHVPAITLLCASALACSPKTLALRGTADALSDPTAGTFARDDDPEFVRDATPFALKTMESL